MASLSALNGTVSLSLTHKGDVADIALSGTYALTTELQREVGSPGSGAWEAVQGMVWSTANATVATTYASKRDNENLRLIVTAYTSGTVVATLTDNTDLLLAERRDEIGNVWVRRYQDGMIFYNESGDVVLDTRLNEQIIAIGDANYTVLAANSGKVHRIANVSADRTITLPTAQNGLHYKFVAEVGAADGHDWIFAAAAAADLFKGGLLVIDTDETPSVASAVVADQSNDDQLQVNVPQGGTVIEMFCDGTFWIVSGTVMATAVPAFS